MTWLFSRAMIQDYENSRSSQALVAESLADTSLAGELSAPLSVMPTPHKFYYRDKTMEFSDLSRFGLTCAALTESRGGELLTWFRAGFPVRTSAPQERVPALMVREVACGQNSPESFVKYNPDLCSWKTRQSLLGADLEEFSGTWPKWGLMRNGECWEPAMSGLIIPVRGFGLLPTPMAADGTHAGGIERRKGRGKYWNLRDWYHCIMGGTVGSPARRRKRAFWEWLMGWPENWTALSAQETDKFQLWLQQHSAFSQE